MARVTVEDCIDKIPNRFELVLLASHRARTISAGAQIAVQRDNDKNPVVALREIADKKIATDDLREDFIHSMQKYVEVDEPEAEAVPMLSSDTRMPVLGQDDPVERQLDRQDDRGGAVAPDGDARRLRMAPMRDPAHADFQLLRPNQGLSLCLTRRHRGECRTHALHCRHGPQ